MPRLKINPDGTPHIHIWVRGHRPDGRKDRNRYICAHPDCNAASNKFDLVGKRSRCSTCVKNDFVLTVADLKRSRPRCLECSTTAEAMKIRKIKEMLELLGIGKEEEMA